MAGKPFAVGAVPGAADLNNMAYIYDRVTTAVDVVNLATEQTLYTKTITGGHLSTNRMLRLRINGDYLGNAAAGRTLTVRVKYGGTTMWGDVNAAPDSDVDRRPFRVELTVANLAATNSQWLDGDVWLGLPLAGSIAGIGDFGGTGPSGTTGWQFGQFAGTATVDSTVDQTLAVTVQHSLADPNASVRLKYAVLELL